MLVSIALTAATVCTARAYVSRDLLGRDRDILLRDRDETETRR